MELKTFFVDDVEYINEDNGGSYRARIISAIANTQATPEAWAELYDAWKARRGDEVYINYARGHWDELVSYMVKARLTA